MSNNYEKVVALISKPAISREDFLIQPLIPWFKKKFKILADIRTEYLKDVIKNCRYEKRKIDDIICKQGEIGNCCYLILAGAIAIYILNKDKDTDDQQNDIEVQIVYKDGKLDRNKLGGLAVCLLAGVQVGEVALENEGQVRSASMVAHEETDLLVIDRDLYNRSVKEVLLLEKKKKLDFIQHNALFRSWTPKYRQQLSMALYTKTFSYESVLVRQGEPVDIIYIILSGQVEIQIDPATHPYQYQKLFLEINQNEADRLIRKVDNVRPPTEVHYSGHIKRRDNPKTMKLCYLGINESIGDVEVLMEQDTYMQTAVCKEKTEVLVLELKHYERLFVKKHPKTIDKMVEQLRVKLNTRVSLLKSKYEVPVLSYFVDKIDSRHRPPQQVDKDRDFKDITIAEAEKEFLNHKGPLIDIFGPGSVFQLIRVRKEKTKNDLRYQRMKDHDRHQGQGGIHSGLLLSSHRPESIHGQRPMSAMSPEPYKPSQYIHNPSPRLDNGDYVQVADPLDYMDDFDRNNSPEAIEYYKSKAEHDEALTVLEDRIRVWLENNSTKSEPKVTQLKRLDLEHLDLQVKPKSRVYFTRKKPLMESSADNDIIITPRKPHKTDELRIL